MQSAAKLRRESNAAYQISPKPTLDTNGYAKKEVGGRGGAYKYIYIYIYIYIHIYIYTRSKQAGIVLEYISDHIVVMCLGLITQKCFCVRRSHFPISDNNVVIRW